MPRCYARNTPGHHRSCSRQKCVATKPARDDTLARTVVRTAPERSCGGESGLGRFEMAGMRPVLVRVQSPAPVSGRSGCSRVVDDAAAVGSWRNDRLVDGTCDEPGRRCCWALLDDDAPVSPTLAGDPFAIDRPSDRATTQGADPPQCRGSADPLAAADRAWASVAGHERCVVCSARRCVGGRCRVATQWVSSWPGAAPDAGRRAHGAVGDGRVDWPSTRSGSASTMSARASASSMSSAT